MAGGAPDGIMRLALEMALRGQGAVEPNPMVGAVVVDDAGTCLGQGWHQRFGGPHAEIHALQQAGPAARGSTLYVTLEPCCHIGKTPPCTQAIIAAGIRRVVAATHDPNPLVAGKGVRELRAAGIEVEIGLLESEAEALLAPFRLLITQGRPWMIAKWAMTLDGKIATRAGDSRWVSGESSRQIVHELRGRVDAVMVGSGTALADDPLLTARPAGPRTAVRVIVDSQARLPVTSQLITTARTVPVLIAAGSLAPAERLTALEDQGAEVIRLPVHDTGRVSLPDLCAELGRRRMTNVLVEGGQQLCGALFDQRLIDEVYAFIAPKLAGGESAPGPLGGSGITQMNEARLLDGVDVRSLNGDLLLHGRVRY